MNVEIRRTRNVTAWLPYALLIIAAGGLGITLMLHRTDLTVASLLVVIPLILGAMVILANRSQVNALPFIRVVEKINFFHLFLVGVLIFICSLIVLIIYPTRTLTYFIMASVSAALLLLQIVSRRSKWTDSLILVEIIFLSLSMIWGTALKYPLYFADTDSLIHLNMIDSIVRTGFIDSLIPTYQAYPLYHIFVATAAEVTGLSLKTALFVFVGLAWEVGVVFAFLIFRDLSGSHRFALVASLFLATSSQIIFYGSYAIARSLAMVFVMFWFYLVFKKASQDLRYLFLSLIIMMTMVMTHHVNVLFVIPVLLIIYFCQVIFSRSRLKQPVEPLFVFLISIVGLSYMAWIAYDMSFSTLPGIIRGLLAMDMALPDNITQGYSFAVMLGAVYYSFVLLMCILGIKAVLSGRCYSSPARKSGAFALAGFVLLVVYVPSFIDLLSLADTILIKRLQLIVSPVIAFLIAYGIKYLFGNNVTSATFSRIIGSLIVPVFLVIVMTFSSLISIGNAQDYDDFPHTSETDTPYFTNSELFSFSFLNEKGNREFLIYSDYQVIRNIFSLGGFANRSVLSGGDIEYISAGYIALRTAELRRKGALTFAVDGKASQSFRYQIDPSHPESDILANLKSKGYIYNDGSVQVSFINES
jgi:hypothetical protein